MRNTFDGLTLGLAVVWVSIVLTAIAALVAMFFMAHLDQCLVVIGAAAILTTTFLALHRLDLM